ncbi:MAG: MotA/TolQ/ExbB proton channel family protein [Rhodoferax sp.]|jgi:biopolymer transport protein ExbB|nr:MotA/TolQ/ExbB proton channel family protein [Rhodoferax sp.]
MKNLLSNTCLASWPRSTRWAAWALVCCAAIAGVAHAQPALPPVAQAASASVAASGDTLISATSLSVGNIMAPASASGPNPYGLQSVWAQGDSVARLTLLLLALMSLLSWYVIIAKLLEQRRLDAQTSAASAALADAKPLFQRFGALPRNNPFRFAVERAFAAALQHHRLATQVDMADWLSQNIVSSVSTLQMRSQEGLSVLATVGATAPFVGLFGTVWGIYNALVTIGSSGQASIDKVAGPVGEALIMTALGLAVAVPAVLGYNWLVRRNRVTLHTMRGFGSELHTQLLMVIEQNQSVSVVQGPA